MGPWLALADHHSVGAVERDVLDVGPPVVFNTYVRGQSRAGESRGGTPPALEGGAWVFDRGDAVMQILQTALANVTIGVLPGADHVNGVDEPFPTAGHLQNRHS